MARPSHKPTAKTKRRVAVCAGGGMSHEEIAIVLGISRPTLYKHYQYEISVGAYQRRAEVVEAMHKAGKAGNVAAARAYMQLAPQVSAPTEESDPAPQKPLGKKEQANADASTAQAGTKWDGLLPGATTLQ